MTEVILTTRNRTSQGVVHRLDSNAPIQDQIKSRLTFMACHDGLEANPELLRGMHLLEVVASHVCDSVNAFQKENRLEGIAFACAAVTAWEMAKRHFPFSIDYIQALGRSAECLTCEFRGVAAEHLRTCLEGLKALDTVEKFKQSMETAR